MQPGNVRIRNGKCMDHLNQTDEPPPWRVFGSGYSEAKPAAWYYTKMDQVLPKSSFCKLKLRCLLFVRLVFPLISIKFQGVIPQSMHLKYFMNYPLLAPLRIGSGCIAYNDYILKLMLLYMSTFSLQTWPSLILKLSTLTFILLEVRLEYLFTTHLILLHTNSRNKVHPSARLQRTMAESLGQQSGADPPSISLLWALRAVQWELKMHA